MADPHTRSAAPVPVLQIRDCHVYYGHSHALQGVDLTLAAGVHAVVGRNGMGKTTLCNAIMGLLPVRRGSIRFQGREIAGLPTHRIASAGIGYTPQGRRLWPSLSVDEHLKLSFKGDGAWTVDRIYETFPRLFERRRNGAGQLSGGEQQMLAISRALLQDPQLLILDEPTEGLAPVIVDRLEKLLMELSVDEGVSILLIEQNIAVATAVSEDIAIMVNGRISQVLPSSQLAADRALQERLLGVGRHRDDKTPHMAPAKKPVTGPAKPPKSPKPVEPEPAGPVAETSDAGDAENAATSLIYVPPTRWSAAIWEDDRQTSGIGNEAGNSGTSDRIFDTKPQPLYKEPPTVPDALAGEDVLVVGTFDTKSAELGYIRDKIASHGLTVKTVDLSTSGKPSSADIPPHMIAAYYPGGASAVFTGDRGGSIRAMTQAFENWIVRQKGIGGVISAGGSGGTALVSPGLRALPVGLPKLIISTVASGDVGQYVGPADITMMYSVTDVQGLNRISRRILANGANAIAGMVKDAQDESNATLQALEKPGLGLSMFGVTTTAVQQIAKALEDRYDCLIFHATGVGGQSMEKLADAGLLAAAIDLTTTEICDMMMGGVFPATDDRFGAFIRTRIPYVGSVGALDMVNFGPKSTIPEKYRDRLFVEHNPQVTLMRTTRAENTAMGEWIAGRINQMTGPVRFFIPEGGVSSLDLPGQPFHDPEADKALFDALTANFKETATRRLIRTPDHINDRAFCQKVVDALEEINPMKRSARHSAS